MKRFREELEPCVDELDDRFWDALESCFDIERNEKSLEELQGESQQLMAAILDQKQFSPTEKTMRGGAALAIGLARRAIEQDDPDESLGDFVNLLIMGGVGIGMMLGAYGGEKKISLLLKQFYAVAGKAGAERRHAKTASLRAWATEKYKAGKWKSANQAAHALRDSILKHGRTIGAKLSEENAQRTIAEWFRKSV